MLSCYSFFNGKPLIQFWQKLLSPCPASSELSPETLLGPEQHILGPGFGWSITYLGGVAEVTVALWGGQAASTPTWQKSCAVESFARALSVFFVTAYFTLAMYAFLARVNPLF